MARISAQEQIRRQQRLENEAAYHRSVRDSLLVRLSTEYVGDPDGLIAAVDAVMSARTDSMQKAREEVTRKQAEDAKAADAKRKAKIADNKAEMAAASTGGEEGD